MIIIIVFFVIFVYLGTLFYKYYKNDYKSGAFKEIDFYNPFCCYDDLDLSSTTFFGTTPDTDTGTDTDTDTDSDDDDGGGSDGGSGSGSGSGSRSEDTDDDEEDDEDEDDLRDQLPSTSATITLRYGGNVRANISSPTYNTRSTVKVVDDGDNALRDDNGNKLRLSTLRGIEFSDEAFDTNILLILVSNKTYRKEGSDLNIAKMFEINETNANILEHLAHNERIFFKDTKKIYIFLRLNDDTAWEQIIHKPTEDVVFFEHDNFKGDGHYISSTNLYDEMSITGTCFDHEDQLNNKESEDLKYFKKKHITSMFIPLKYLVTTYSAAECKISGSRCSRKVNDPETGDALAKYKSSFTKDDIERLCSDDDQAKKDPHSISVATRNKNSLSHKF